MLIINDNILHDMADAIWEKSPLSTIVPVEDRDMLSIYDMQRLLSTIHTGIKPANIRDFNMGTVTIIDNAQVVEIPHYIGAIPSVVLIYPIEDIGNTVGAFAGVFTGNVNGFTTSSQTAHRLSNGGLWEGLPGQLIVNNTLIRFRTSTVAYNKWIQTTYRWIALKFV